VTQVIDPATVRTRTTGGFTPLPVGIRSLFYRYKTDLPRIRLDDQLVPTLT